MTNNHTKIDLEDVHCACCGKDDAVHLITTRAWHKGRVKNLPCRVVLCRKCGLGYLNPRMTAGQYDQFYTSDYWQLNRGDPTQLSVTHRDLGDRIGKFAAPADAQQLGANQKILDVGCGTGEILDVLVKNIGAEGWGIESSSSAASWGKEKFGLNIIQSDFFENSLPDGSFELIIASAILEHFLDPLAALREMKRLLTPQGRLFIRVPNLEGLTFRHRGPNRVFKVVHTYYFTPATLSALLAVAGFDQQHIAVHPPANGKAQGEIWGIYQLSSRSSSNPPPTDYREIVASVRRARMRGILPRLAFSFSRWSRRRIKGLLRPLLPGDLIQKRRQHAMKKTRRKTAKTHETY